MRVPERCQHRQDGPVAAAALPPPSVCEHTDCLGGRSSSTRSGSMLMGGAAIGDEAELRAVRDWCGSGGGSLAKAIRQDEVCATAEGRREQG